MKKILVFILGVLTLNSCDGGDVRGTKIYQEKCVPTAEYININGCKYYKIKVGNHNVYQYKFHTGGKRGSDIIHFKDMCNYCKNSHN